MFIFITISDNERSPQPEGGLVNCTWYTSKSCCKRTEVTSVFAAMDPLYGATKLCRNYINYLMCFFCSPDQGRFYKSNKVHVCLEYCESLYEECKNAGFNNMLIGEAYANGTSFCEAQNFEVVENSDCFKFNPNVFGSSMKITPLSLQAFFMLSVFSRKVLLL
ncbi:voltage-dependent calcium channel subunit alpha-2/delta-3-like [Elysia marginata]|uniref:Voltage-dependent calcium channel subunit alpha-2/delta-3-like n=1 Tax=Elysia marginata TaxID=1093978 RepID=A0AAV4JBC7_9GAST|nr:voltage-dependent calcium channel subunit alpha-2/delta-3-like [Elysia marginata]